MMILRYLKTILNKAEYLNSLGARSVTTYADRDCVARHGRLVSRPKLPGTLSQ